MAAVRVPAAAAGLARGFRPGILPLPGPPAWSSLALAPGVVSTM